MPGKAGQHIGLAINFRKGLHDGAFIFFAWASRAKIVMSHMSLESVTRMAGARMHRTQDSHVGEKLFSGLCKISVPDVSCRVNRIVVLPPFQNAIAFIADALQSVHDIVFGIHRIEHVVTTPSTLQKPVNQKLWVLVRTDCIDSHVIGSRLHRHAVSRKVIQEVNACQTGNRSQRPFQEASTGRIGSGCLGPLRAVQWRSGLDLVAYAA